MSQLELSSLKYPPLEKLGNLANKAQNNADGVEQLIKILPVFEAKINEAMEQKMETVKEEKTVQANATPNKDSNRPFFTGNGKAEQAVRNMQRAAKSLNRTEEEMER